jgi:hypothetical protein
MHGSVNLAQLLVVGDQYVLTVPVCCHMQCFVQKPLYCLIQILWKLRHGLKEKESIVTDAVLPVCTSIDRSQRWLQEPAPWKIRRAGAGAVGRGWNTHLDPCSVSTERYSAEGEDHVTRLSLVLSPTIGAVLPLLLAP